ncbi:MAG: glycoside hydrolase family 25 protein [Lachnospiraceae bacterium]
MTSTDTKDLLEDLEFISENPDITPSVHSRKSNAKSNSKRTEKKEEAKSISQKTEKKEEVKSNSKRTEKKEEAKSIDDDINVPRCDEADLNEADLNEADLNSEIERVKSTKGQAKSAMGQVQSAKVQAKSAMGQVQSAKVQAKSAMGQEKRNTGTIINRKKSKNGLVHAFLPITILLSLTTLASIALCFYLLHQMNKKEVPASADSVVESRMYAQEEVDAMVLDAKEEGTATGQQELKDFIRSMAIENSGSYPDVLRKIFPEYMIYNAGGKYAFVPIDNNMPRNSISENQIMESGGEMTYVVDGITRSRKMIDVSQHQGNIDWQQVADSGVEMAIIRLGIRGYGSGALVMDEYFAQNMEGATAAGLEVGVYFFTQAISIEEAQEEADFVLESLKEYDFNGTIVLDIEKVDDNAARGNALTPEERTAFARVFCDRIRDAGYRPMIYGNAYSLFAMLDITELKEYDVWYAFYNNYLYYPYEVRAWQYSSTSTVPGISGDVDLNIWFE